MHQIREWILAFRPKTLTAAVVPIIAATALVYGLGFEIKWWISILALVASLFIQIGTNLVNDASDFKKGADTADRIGPKRVTQAGVFSAKKVMWTASGFFGAAVLCGIPLVIQGGWPIVGIGIFSVICGYAYTAGPFPLAYRGLGDLFVILFFGIIAVGGLFYLQTGFWAEESFVLGLQIGFHCAVLIAINNLRDIETDKLVNKKTLQVRFGKDFARYEITVLCFLPFVLLNFWFVHGFNFTAISYLVLPLAARITFLVFKTEPSPAYNKFLGMSAGLHVLFGLLISIGLILK